MIRVRVPASTANLGCGFDCMGLALEMECICSFEALAEGLSFEHVEAQYRNAENPAVQAWYRVLGEAGEKPGGVKVRIDSGIPVARGLGSSAALIAAGLTAANRFCGDVFPLRKLIEIGTELEGHPDNIAPALLGGLVISARAGDHVVFERGRVSEKLRFHALIPPFPLSTQRAREVLPDTVSRSDAVHELGRAALLPGALARGDLELIRFCTDDRLHQPYRKALIPGWDRLFAAADQAGSAMCLSGAGPTILVITGAEGLPEEIRRAAEELPDRWEVRDLSVCGHGCVSLL